MNGKGTFVDGGLAANNPAMCAYVEVLKLLRREGIDPATRKIIVVSLGTGAVTLSLSYDKIKNWIPLNWIAGPLISSFFDGNSTTVEYQLREILQGNCYYRFQLILPNEKGSDELDNTDKKFLDEISELTQHYIEEDNINSLPIGWANRLNDLYKIL